MIGAGSAGASRRRFDYAQRLLSMSETGQNMMTVPVAAHPEEGLSPAKARLEGPECKQ
ncbi:MAG: hypothetical protein QOI38_1464 [Sphingomonadales bacterium]|jgi:hypothetical protein|nr:hypothetical protein [Sphingomonadales bacterium]